MSPFALVPWPYRVLAIVVLCVGLVAFGWLKGAAHVRDAWDASLARDAIVVARIEKKQAEETVRVVTQYVDRVKVVHDKAETITREVPVYVTPTADAACPIPRGFVRLHDAAAAAQLLPGAAGPADGEPAGVALSAVAETVASNYGACHATAEQLKALQEWVTSMRKAAQ